MSTYETKAGGAMVAIGPSGAGAAQIAGYASTFENIDLQNDVVVKGAFAESIKARPRVALLWGHQVGEPIGLVTRMCEDARGLAFTGILADTQRGRDAKALLGIGALACSIGYNVKQSGRRAGGVRTLLSLDLIEVSLTPTPANPLATVALAPAEAAHLRDMFMIETVSEHLREGDELHPRELESMAKALANEIERAEYGGRLRAEAQAELRAELAKERRRVLRVR